MAKSDRITALIAALDVAADAGAGAPGDPRYLGFFHCFNAGDYYEAHDVLEDLWLATRGPDHAFFKGLIQVAGAFVHLRKQSERPDHPHAVRRLRAAARLFAAAAGHLAAFAPRHHRLDVGDVLRLCERYRIALQEAEFAENPWSPEARPRLDLERGPLR